MAFLKESCRQQPPCLGTGRRLRGRFDSFAAAGPLCPRFRRHRPPPSARPPPPPLSVRASAAAAPVCRLAPNPSANLLRPPPRRHLLAAAPAPSFPCMRRHLRCRVRAPPRPQGLRAACCCCWSSPPRRLAVMLPFPRTLCDLRGSSQQERTGLGAAEGNSRRFSRRLGFRP